VGDPVGCGVGFGAGAQAPMSVAKARMMGAAAPGDPNRSDRDPWIIALTRQVDGIALSPNRAGIAIAMHSRRTTGRQPSVSARSSGVTELTQPHCPKASRVTAAARPHYERIVSIPAFGLLI